jgi:hypothetical protein
MDRWRDELGAIRLALARRRYLRLGPQRGLGEMVAFAILAMRQEPSGLHFTNQHRWLPCSYLEYRFYQPHDQVRYNSDR